MSTWLINGSTPEAIGLTLTGGEFVFGRASTVRLEAAADFDAAEVFPAGTAVTITRDGDPFFKGTARRIPKAASGGSEGRVYHVEDAWADLERTTYQEPWAIGAGSVDTPLVVLGVNSSGTRIHLGEQIEEAIAYAAAAGVSIQIGTVPTGMLLWPTEVRGISCASVIRECLRYHPDWLPWIDHSTEPPTFNVTPRSSASEVDLAATDCEGFSITEDADAVPDAVRIVYLTTSQTGDEVYRDVAIDKYPSGGPDSGPGVLSTVVELAGVNAQIQKQQVVTRALPTDAASLETWLKKKFPFLADIPDTHWTFSGFSKTFVDENEDPADEPGPINPNAVRLKGAEATDLPRELVDGAIHEWMRRKVGWIKVEFEVEATGSATEAERTMISRIPRTLAVRATNATSKIYKGLSSWTPGESAPAGIAQSYYQTISGACRFSGSATVLEDEVGATQWHGRVLNLIGGPTAWASMKAPIHRVAWDLQTRRTTLDFGPTTEYGLTDHVEYLRLLTKRDVRWMSADERVSNRLGDEAGPSFGHDNVGPRDGPETLYTGGAGGGSSGGGAFWTTFVHTDGHTYLQGGTVKAGGGTKTMASVNIFDSGTGPTQAAGTHMYLAISGTGVVADGFLLPGFNATEGTITPSYNSTVPSDTLPTASSSSGTVHIDLGVFTATGFLPAAAGNRSVSFCPGAFTVSP